MSISIKLDTREFDALPVGAAAQTSKAWRATVAKTARDTRRIALDVGVGLDDVSAVGVKRGVPTVSAAQSDIMLGEVELLRGIVPSHGNPSAYTGAKVLMIGGVEPDREKSSAVDVMMSANHTTSLTAVLQRQGVDLDGRVAFLKHVRDVLLANGSSPDYAAVTHRQIDEAEKDEGMAVSGH